MASFCSFCFHEYIEKTRRPRILPCTHDLCEICVPALFQESDKKFIRCPVCQVEHKVSPMSRHISYGAIAKGTQSKVITAGNASKVSPKCEKSECRRTGFKICTHCNRWLCAPHFKQERKEITIEMQKPLRDGKNRLSAVKNLSRKISETGKQKINSLKISLQSINSMTEKLSKMREEISQELFETENTVSKEEEILGKEEMRLREMVDGIEEAFRSNKSPSELWPMNLELLRHLKTEDTGAVIEVSSVDIDWKSLQEAFNILLSKIKVYKEKIDVNVSLLNGINRPLSAKSPVSARAAFSLLKGASVQVAHVVGKPQDIAVCHNTNGFSVEAGRVIQGDKGDRMPSPSFFVKFLGEEKHMVVLDENGDQKARVVLNLHVFDQHNQQLWNVACWEKQQRLLITDISRTNRCVHMCDLSGQTVRRTVEGLLTNPRGVCIQQTTNDSEVQHQLIVCDASSPHSTTHASRLVIFSLPELQHLSFINHKSLADPVYPIISEQPFRDYVIVANNQSGQLSVFTLPDYKFIGKFLHFDKLCGLEKHNSGRIFATYAHGVSEISICETASCEDSTEPCVTLSRIQSQEAFCCGDLEFDHPRGLTAYTSSCVSTNEQNIVICDLMSLRLKFYSLRYKRATPSIL